MFPRRHIFCGLLLSVLMAGCATTNTGGPTVDSGAVVIANEDFRVGVVFSDYDRKKIRKYYKRKHASKKMPPGLAKKQKLPPGLRKHIKKHRELPPGLEGRRLPRDLERTLHHLPDGYMRLSVGGDILLMHERTRYILDVVFDVK